jgi:hypothetical protein
MVAVACQTMTARFGQGGAESNYKYGTVNFVPFLTEPNPEA